MGEIQFYAIILLMGGVIGGLVLMFHLRRKFGKIADANLWVEMIPKDGSKSKDFMLPVDSGRVQLPKGKDGKSGKAYMVDEYNTFPAAYPKGLPGFLQSTATKTVVYEESLKPAIQNRNGEGSTDSSARLFNILNERFSGLALEMSKTIEEYEQRLKQQLNPTIVYVILGVNTVALVGVIIILMMVMGDVSSLASWYGI